MRKIVRFTDVTYSDGERCFPGVDFGRYSLAEVEPAEEGERPTFAWVITSLVCGPHEFVVREPEGWVLREEEVEDVTEDEVDAAIAYCALMGMYVGERVDG